jgi:electron transfer flavoprotein beta subunit
MKIAVPVNLVPDLVEELTIDASGAALDMTWARLKVNEFDDHAIEQAILLKERGGGEVIVLAPDLDGSDDVLFTAAARGADQLIKLTGGFEGGVNSHALARAFTAPLKELGPDLVLVGVQAHKDLDGQVGPLLAEYLEFPYVGYVSGVAMEGEKTVIKKEYPGGLIAKMEVSLPAVLGIQAMKTTSIQEHEVAELDPSGSPTVARMFQPEVGERATMLEGGVDEVAAQLVKIMKERGIL